MEYPMVPSGIFDTEIICYSSANDGKGIGLREFSAAFHCFGVCQERYFFALVWSVPV